MSASLMGRATWHQGITCPEKMVLVAIADVSDDSGLAYMLLQTLMQKSSLSRRGAQSALAGLISKGILLRKERKHRSSIFKIVVESLPLGRPPMSERELSDDHFWDNIKGAGDAPSDGNEGAGGAPQRARRAPQGAGGAHILPVDTPVLTPDSPLSFGEDTPTEDSDQNFQLTLTSSDPRSIDLMDYIAAEWEKLSKEYKRIPAVKAWTQSRADLIKRRTKEYLAKAGANMTAHDVWEAIFRAIRNDDWLRGDAPPSRGYTKAFAVDIDYLLRTNKIAITLEKDEINAERNRQTHNPDTGRRYGPAEQAGREILARLGHGKK